jgi:hypothetical protein
MPAGGNVLIAQYLDVGAAAMPIALSASRIASAKLLSSGHGVRHSMHTRDKICPTAYFLSARSISTLTSLSTAAG